MLNDQRYQIVIDHGLDLNLIPGGDVGQEPNGFLKNKKIMLNKHFAKFPVFF